MRNCFEGVFSEGCHALPDDTGLASAASYRPQTRRRTTVPPAHPCDGDARLSCSFHAGLCRRHLEPPHGYLDVAVGFTRSCLEGMAYTRSRAPNPLHVPSRTWTQRNDRDIHRATRSRVPGRSECCFCMDHNLFQPLARNGAPRGFHARAPSGAPSARTRRQMSAGCELFLERFVARHCHTGGLATVLIVRSCCVMDAGAALELRFRSLLFEASNGVAHEQYSGACPCCRWLWLHRLREASDRRISWRARGQP